MSGRREDVVLTATGEKESQRFAFEIIGKRRLAWDSGPHLEQGLKAGLSRFRSDGIPSLFLQTQRLSARPRCLTPAFCTCQSEEVHVPGMPIVLSQRRVAGPRSRVQDLSRAPAPPLCRPTFQKEPVARWPTWNHLPRRAGRRIAGSPGDSRRSLSLAGTALVLGVRADPAHVLSPLVSGLGRAVSGAHTCSAGACRRARAHASGPRDVPDSARAKGPSQLIKQALALPEFNANGVK
ncbi:hypothetical protein AAFF_G00042090 [Aldrovandia affinis]|uniref:Uncharacterized protein n=1 Tax=Aldrovandia affinis TaxID=143900 RepID=A0AAD7S2M3_9TELE|nr:hypothetical protein AAFF_G00042090 [Aldrovandia affinis]